MKRETVDLILKLELFEFEKNIGSMDGCKKMVALSPEGAANAFNLLDKHYYESGQTNTALPGTPLSGQNHVTGEILGATVFSAST